MDHQDSFQLQKHLNEHQVSEITGLSVKTLQKYRHEGNVLWKLSCVVYPELDLASWLNSKRGYYEYTHPSDKFSNSFNLFEETILDLLNLNFMLWRSICEDAKQSHD